jgi:hypothetical protein
MARAVPCAIAFPVVESATAFSESGKPVPIRILDTGKTVVFRRPQELVVVVAPAEPVGSTVIVPKALETKPRGTAAVVETITPVAATDTVIEDEIGATLALTRRLLMLMVWPGLRVLNAIWIVVGPGWVTVEGSPAPSVTTTSTLLVEPETNWFTKGTLEVSRKVIAPVGAGNPPPLAAV